MQLDARQIQMIIRGVIILLVIIAFIITYNLHTRIYAKIKEIKARHQEELAHEVTITILPSKMHERLTNEMQKPSRRYFNYDRIDRFLKQNGAGFVSNYFINPVNFIFIKCVIALLGVCVGLLSDFSAAGCLIFGIAGFFLLDYLIRSQNNSDNKKMLNDIKRANEVIKMYEETSETLYNAIFECYKFTENTRLKKGFFELYGELQMTHSYELACAHFLEKFNNGYIYALARNIQQAGTLGCNPQLLEDMAKDMEELQHELNYNYKQNLETQWGVLLLLGFSLTMIICIYGMMGDMTNVWM